jgi:membrane-bound lytic murein transglycosylase A
MIRQRVAFGALLIVFLVATCVPTPPPPARPKLTLESVAFAELPGWQADRVAEAIPALLKSCARRLAQPDDAKVGPGGIGGTVKDWRAPCAAAALVQPGDDAAARQFLEAAFLPYRAGNNGVSEGLFTGYYEPLLEGAREKGGADQTPILGRPDDLVMVELGLFRPVWRGEHIAGRVVKGALVPYPARAEIEHGAIDADKLALYWVTDPVDEFFLEIQGSGKIKLSDGSLVNVGYDAQNGRPYVAIGKLLVERGQLTADQVSLAAIKDWIHAHPAEGKALMDENPSVVFFREIKGDAPIGAEGAVLTPGRSLAIDAAFVPIGIPVWLDAKNGTETLRRLVVAQDTGGAIRGPVRGDLFWGFGADAERGAGAMKARGSYYLLLPKGATQPLPPAS